MPRAPLLLALLLVLTLPTPAAPPDFSKADALISAAIDRGDCPGAALLVGRSTGIVHEKAFGHRALEPAREPMTPGTIFDIASLTKPVATATAVLILIDRNFIDPAAPAAKYLPEFTGHSKETITVEHLLLHRAGLIPDNPLKDYADGPAKAWERICALPLKSKPGEKFAYSDVGFIVLGKLVERVDPKKRTLDRFCADEIFTPLGMTDTSYLPPAEKHARTAPTEKRDGAFIRGQVHDPRAHLMGGVAGHAGAFSTARDLARYCHTMLHKGAIAPDFAPPAPNAPRLFSEKTWLLAATPNPLPDGTGVRSYGFDVKTGYSQPLGDRFTPLKSFGHTGFTGTSLWISPADDAYVILLTNSVHPNGRGKVLALRRAVSTAVAEALLGPAPNAGPAGRIDQSDRERSVEIRAGFAAPSGEAGRAAVPAVLPGLDVLKADHFKALAGRKIALVTNHTGRDVDGNRTVDLLKAAPDVTLVTLLSPEHGLYGQLDEKVGHGVDERTGLKVWSVYGDTRTPTDAMLANVDTVVFDIQDVGTRFYTYPATMANCMRACAARKLKMVVLDRPNPIAPLPVDGPVADAKYHGFTAVGPLPLVHGMTVGELARLFNAEYGISCDLTVVECKNWDRSMWWDATNLTWVNPSPNMRNPTQATIYPAVGMIEFSNVSVGRGTDQPFELFGAPWADPRKLAAALNARNLPGLRFVPIEFTPTSSKFKGESCKGCYVLVTDRTAIQPARTGITIAAELERLFADGYKIDNVARLLQNDRAMTALVAGQDPAALPAAWADDLAKFKAVREKYLIYK
ncbi:MAG TPA: exo-beta-N-acetylmuramidase NamZ domain-containing protein [Tepidisphaeraceae bacterium]|nr:exo-beta-N-acetylmuramidase NamZ domain-containing protein [Tepidisphaeraceae bacterium]